MAYTPKSIKGQKEQNPEPVEKLKAKKKEKE
jgi:hypothetical protein